MAATISELKSRRRATSTAGGPSVRTAIDAFLDAPKIKGNPNTLRADTNVLDLTPTFDVIYTASGRKRDT